ncbi:MAG: UvrB/UvrC motif-containing protein [Candidatus Omnitrophica bacterium]|nr:Protein-arginine kinase activator protein [bacterium]NUN98280.1 UvrB/UvrC motif-containing protein [Candidatus Omnitrophota bacterium]
MNGKICQVCQQKVAKIHITQIHQGQVHEFHICQECARENNVSGPEMKPVFTPEFLGGGIPGEEAARPGAVEEVKTCPSCGQTYRGFRESGRLGCCRCYDTFAEELEPLLRKVQGGVRHIGKTPRRESVPEPRDSTPRIEAMREKLRLAVSEEDFETAARLRDEIRNLEGRLAS